MTVLDILVLILVGVAAVGGFVRGMVQEFFSFAAWILAAFAVRTLHGSLTDVLAKYLGYSGVIDLLAVALLLLIPYAAMRVITNNVSPVSAGRVMGPIDRVLGFGFGTVKGVLIAIFAYSGLVLGFDDSWGAAGRPDWITLGRSYDFLDSASRELVPSIAQRHEYLEDISRAAR